MRAEVTALVSFGVTQNDIAAYLDINPETLRKHYRRELDTGQIKGNAGMARRLYKAAEEGSVPAMIFWLKVRAGWSERTILDHSSSDGSMTPAPTVVKIIAG
jgi:predicted transcriptional regulator